MNKYTVEIEVEFSAILQAISTRNQIPRCDTSRLLQFFCYVFYTLYALYHLSNALDSDLQQACIVHKILKVKRAQLLKNYKGEYLWITK